MKRLLLLLCFLPGLSLAGTYSWPIVWPASNSGLINYDSLKYTIYEGNTVYASDTFASFPVNDSVSLNDASEYKVVIEWSYSGMNGWDTPIEYWISPSVVEASATVNYSMLNDTLAYYHGSGSWTGQGDGDLACEFLVLDASDSTPVQNIHVTVWNTEDTFTLTSDAEAVGTTGADGKFTANLGTSDTTRDSFVVVYDAPGWTITYDSVITISLPTYDTTYATWYTPSAPGSPNLCAVYGYVYDLLGDVGAGRRVTFTLERVTRNICDSTFNYRKAAPVVTNASGRFDINLPPSACWEDTVRYQMDIQGSDDAFLITIPDSSTFRVVTGERL